MMGPDGGVSAASAIIAEARRIAREEIGSDDPETTQLVLALVVLALAGGTCPGFMRLRPRQPATLDLDSAMPIGDPTTEGR